MKKTYKLNPDVDFNQYLKNNILYVKSYEYISGKKTAIVNQISGTQYGMFTYIIYNKIGENLWEICPIHIHIDNILPKSIKKLIKLNLIIPTQ